MNEGTLKVRVARKTVEAEGIAGFELVSAEGTPLPSFSAGSHIDVHVPDGPVRQYSLCNDPAETHRYQIAVLRDLASRGGSKGLHESVREGDILCISAPKNHFALEHEASSSLLLAGGIGITPILCMAERLHVMQAAFEMHYCAKDPERAAFGKRIRDSAFGGKVHFHFSEDGSRLDLESLIGEPARGQHIYVCGPKRFMDAVLHVASARGWPEAQLHYEYFAGVAATEPGDSFEVQLASSGRVVVVPAGVSALEALEAAGIAIPYSCSEGICGTCATRVLEGTPDHKDLYFSPHEQAKNDCFTPCCSRAKSRRLVLDL